MAGDVEADVDRERITHSHSLRLSWLALVPEVELRCGTLRQRQRRRVALVDRGDVNDRAERAEQLAQIELRLGSRPRCAVTQTERRGAQGPTRIHGQRCCK